MSQTSDASYVEAWVSSFAPVTEIARTPDEDEEWIVRGLLRAGTYMIVFGREGKGKSRILYQLATAIADRSSWFGFNVEDTGNVVFLQADMAPKESKAIVRSAESAGLLREAILFPRAFGVIDVLTPDGLAVLQGIQDVYRPKVLVVDTATDVFEPKREHAEDGANGPIRACIRAFRSTFPDAGIIFVLHERKASQFLQAKGIEDEDAALGGGEWTRKAASVVRIKGVNDTHISLDVRKTRDKVPFRKIQLIRTPHGFFEVERDAVDPLQALALWPHIEGLEDFEDVDVSVSEVCRSIESVTKGRLTFDAVRKAYHRAKEKQVEFGWERRLGQNRLGHVPNEA